MVTLSNCYDHTHTHYVVNVLATKNILSVKTGLNGTVTAASSVSRNVHTQSLHVACTERRRKMENARTLQTVGPGRWPVISWQLVECTSSKLAEGQPANRDAGKKKEKRSTNSRLQQNTHVTTSIHVSLTWTHNFPPDTKLTLQYRVRQWQGCHDDGVSVMHKCCPQLNAMNRACFLAKFVFPSLTEPCHTRCSLPASFSSWRKQ